MSETLENKNENTILAEKTEKILDDTLGIDEPHSEAIMKPSVLSKIKKPKGRPKNPVSNEELEFKKRVAEETEKAYREVIETKIKTNIKKELRNKALEDGDKYKDPEPKEEKPKRKLNEKQMENLAKGREIAKQKTKQIKEVYKTIDDEVIANATTDNLVLISNTITFEDMSTTIDTFKADALSTATQDAFMDIHTNNIIDIFNYGNFINRSDNPIINSSFQLNGKNRFQERDGFFYNYLQMFLFQLKF